MQTPERILNIKTPTAVLSQSVRGSQMMAGCMDGVYVIDLDAKSVERVDQHDSYVSSVAHVPGRDLVVTAGYDGAVHWLHSRHLQRIRREMIHDFWSWDMAVSPDGQWIASVTGQYLAGGYKYQPLPEREPSVKLLSVETGEVVRELPHVPSVQAVAFSPDSSLVAAGNLMGEVRIWNVESGQQVATIETPDFTSWGIIKSHCYLGGVFALQFAPNGKSILLAGMGPMRDPMAGNGKQRWQQWRWDGGQPEKIAETKADQAGEGLMETLAAHPDRGDFVMAGRLRGGQWNVGVFDWQSGDRLTELKTGYRVTQAAYSEDGRRLILAGTQGQPRNRKEGAFPDFGRVEIYEW